MSLFPNLHDFLIYLYYFLFVFFMLKLFFKWCYFLLPFRQYRIYFFDLNYLSNIMIYIPSQRDMSVLICQL